MVSALKVKYRKAAVPRAMATASYQGKALTFWWPFLAGKTRKPIITIQAMKEVSRISSSQPVNSVTYRQKMEKAARMQVTTTLGLPSQTRTLDSRSYFFMTASRSMGSWTAGADFFLKKAIEYPPWEMMKLTIDN